MKIENDNIKTDKKTWYDILKVESTCNTADIKKSYKILAKKYHPDLFISKKLNSTETKEVHERFVKISNAYKILSTKELRDSYDKFLLNSSNYETASNNKKENPFEFTKWTDLFEEDLYRSIRKKGDSVHVYAELTLDQFINGCSKKIRLEKDIINVTIHKMTKPYSIIKIPGKGLNNSMGINPGDLFINLTLKFTKNIKFNKKLNLLYYTCKVTYQDIILGSTITIKSIIDPEKLIKIKIPKGIKPGTDIRLKNQGIKSDLILKLELFIPKKISKDAEKLIKELNKEKSLINKSEQF